MSRRNRHFLYQLPCWIAFCLAINPLSGLRAFIAVLAVLIWGFLNRIEVLTEER
jgi:hypothetical protein